MTARIFRSTGGSRPPRLTFEVTRSVPWPSECLGVGARWLDRIDTFAQQVRRRERPSRDASPLDAFTRFVSGCGRQRHEQGGKNGCHAEKSDDADVRIGGQKDRPNWCCAPGNRRGDERRKCACRHHRQDEPIAAAGTLRARLSVASCRTTRHRLAPSAIRTAISRDVRSCGRAPGSSRSRRPRGERASGPLRKSTIGLLQDRADAAQAPCLY